MLCAEKTQKKHVMLQLNLEVYGCVSTPEPQEQIKFQATLRVLSHGNDNDCASFSRPSLELVTMQKYAEQNMLEHKKMII